MELLCYCHGLHCSCLVNSALERESRPEHDGALRPLSHSPTNPAVRSTSAICTHAHASQPSAGRSQGVKASFCGAPQKKSPRMHCHHTGSELAHTSIDLKKESHTSGRNTQRLRPAAALSINALGNAVDRAVGEAALEMRTSSTRKTRTHSSQGWTTRIKPRAHANAHSTYTINPPTASAFSASCQPEYTTIKPQMSTITDPTASCSRCRRKQRHVAGSIAHARGSRAHGERNSGSNRALRAAAAAVVVAAAGCQGRQDMHEIYAMVRRQSVPLESAYWHYFVHQLLDW